ncbi:MAG: UDP-N-acetylmuramoyl-L-alanine--D-glutamate ligase [Ignavibacteria bacterium]
MRNVKDIKRHSYVVLGAGRSGVSAAKLLKSIGAEVFLSDNHNIEDLRYVDIQELDDFSIKYEFGSHSERVFDCDYWILSPGIPPHSDIIKAGTEKKIKLISEIELASWLCPARVIAITGTNGKTTTTMLIEHILRYWTDKVFACGNVGVAFSDVIEKLDKESLVVLEVSSFQLKYIETFKPYIAILTNFSIDHLDWHQSVEDYLNSKLKINLNQDNNDYLIFNYDDRTFREKMDEFKGNVAAFSLKYNLREEGIVCGGYLENSYLWYFDKVTQREFDIIRREEIFIKGTHNLYNSLAAIISTKITGVENELLRNALRDFKGVEHRIEFVKEIGGVKFYNDSKATNYDSLAVALESFESNIILIMGGKKGDNNFHLIDDFVKKKVKKIFTIGQSSDVIAEHYDNVIKCDSLRMAVREAYKYAVSGDIVLFSPGYKSFDMFENFEQRGKAFKVLVNCLNDGSGV